MRYTLYGVDGVSREPREPLSIEAASEADARAQAKALGMAVADVVADQPEPAPAAAPVESPLAFPRAGGRPPDPDHPVARVLVIAFRVLAGVAALLYLVLFVLTLEAASRAEEAARRLGGTVEVPVGAALVRVILEAVLVVSLLLAVAEFLRLGMALERNTRARHDPGERRRHR